MDRARLLPIQLPPASSLSGNHGNTRGKVSFMKRLVFGFIILAGLGLLYVPAYLSAPGPIPGLGETTPPVRSVGSTHFVASVGMHLLTLFAILSRNMVYYRSFYF